MPIQYYPDLEQGTDEWHQMRLGIVTASNINTILTPTGKPAKNEKMRQYACEIASQRILRVVEDSYQSFDMQRGHFQEVIARDIYSDNYAPVTECGFVINDNYGPVIGCSPDGLVNDDGGIEIKSRLAKFQVSTIIADEFPKMYANQVQGFLIVTEREWCDFVQYSNGMPFFVKRIYPDPVRQAEIVHALVEFEYEVARVLSEYKERSDGMVQTERVEFVSDDTIEGSE
jgi:putative phage-type endonuclease